MSKNIRGKSPTARQKKLLARAGKYPNDWLYVNEYRSPIDGTVYYTFVDRTTGKTFRINMEGGTE